MIRFRDAVAGVLLVGGARSEEAQERVLVELIRQRLLATAAREAGYESDPDIHDTIERMLAERYLRDLMRRNPVAPMVTNDDARAHYDANLEDFREPERLRASVILLAFPPRAKDEDRKRVREQAEAMLAELRSANDRPARFTEVASRRSDDVCTQGCGGDLGWLSLPSCEGYVWANTIR